MSKKNKKMNNYKNMTDVSVKANIGMPKTASEMVNFYGTYEIQPTADTDNQYPAIAQGYNSKIRARDGQNKHHGHSFEKDD